MKKYNFKHEKLAESIGMTKDELSEIVYEYNKLVNKMNSTGGQEQARSVQRVEKFAKKSPGNLRFICALATGAFS